MSTNCFQVIGSYNGKDVSPLQLCFNQNGAFDAAMSTIENSSVEVDGAVVEKLTDYTFSDLNTLWLLIAGALVFLMQLGFGMLEAGTVRSKNVSNILFKNIMDAGLGAICWFLIGYGFAYGGDDDNAFIGTDNFALNLKNDFAGWFFQWAFAATAATIVSGSVAERIRIEAYFIYSIIITIFIYPVVVHWVWDSNGGLSAFNPDSEFPAVDFAGSGVVHMVGGFSGLMGAIVLGPRSGRFDGGDLNQTKFRGHSLPLQVIGTFLLWFGWYGFNCGSTLAVQGVITTTAARVAVTTTLGAAGGSISAETFNYFTAVKPSFDLSKACNGALAGLVSITAGCSVVSPGSSIIIGFLGGIFYCASSQMLVQMKIDDPLDAFPVHGFCGLWGVLAAGLFSTNAILAEAQYSPTIINSSIGERFTNQLIEVLAVVAWTVVTSGIMFWTMHMTMGIRVSKETEKLGMDKAEHGGTAYTMGSPLKGSTVGPAGTNVEVELRETIDNNDVEEPPVSKSMETVRPTKIDCTAPGQAGQV